MISICLTKFVKNSPWGDVVADAFFKALSSYKNEISVEKSRVILKRNIT